MYYKKYIDLIKQRHLRDTALGFFSYRISTTVFIGRYCFHTKTQSSFIICFEYFDAYLLTFIEVIRYIIDALWNNIIRLIYSQ